MPFLVVMWLCLAMFLCLAPLRAAPFDPAKLVLCCAEENDLYRVLKENGIAAPRFDQPEQAVREAPPGAGVMILADGYPDRTTEVSATALAEAARKKLRLYVEYCATLPGLPAGEPRTLKTGYWGNVLERTVVTSEAFGPELPKMRIVVIHDGHYLPVEAKNPHLALAHVAGYDAAVFGLPPENVWPILFEHPGGDILVSTTKLSQFVTARYAPTDAWGPIWQRILRWLQPDREPPPLKWTPTVQPSFGPDEPLPQDLERQTIQRATEWFLQSRLLVHPDWEDQYDHPANMGPPTEHWPWGHRCGPRPDPTWPVGDGSRGMLEGFRSKILYDGSQAVLWWRRHDCNAEAAGAMAMAGALLGNERYQRIAANLGDWLYFQSHVSRGDRADLRNPAFGLFGWNDVPRYYGDQDGYGVYYTDDNARGLLGMLKAASALPTDRWDERAMQGLLANLRITGRYGFSPDRIDHGPLLANGWPFYFGSSGTNYAPHHQGYMQACFLWAYRQTGYPLFLDRARTAIRLTMQAYPDQWPMVNGQIELERARFLLPLAWLVRVEDTPEHRQWLRRMAADLLADQQESGAIYTRIVQGATSNEAYGTAETSLIQANGDPITDTLYSLNFAFVGLREAVVATGDPFYREAEDRIAEFLCRILTRSEAHPELDGVWYRGFDFKRWDYWGSDADVGWGVWSTETGWTQGEIIATLVLRQWNTSLWDYLADRNVAPHFEKWREPMLPDEVVRQSQPRPIRHAAVGQPVALAPPADPRYPGQGPSTLTDGYSGDPAHASPAWMGFEGTDFEATVDLGQPTLIRELGAGFLQSLGVGIFLPKEVEWAVSEDGQSFRPVRTLAVPTEREPSVKPALLTATELNVPARYVRVRAKNVGVIPAWHPAQGLKAWLFVDEIVVNPEAGN